jgi:phosphate transport system permease protein
MDSYRSNKLSERSAHGLLALAALLSAALTVSIFIFMAALGLPLLGVDQLYQVLTGPWSPDHHIYGIYPMIWGTLCIAMLALLLAVPISLGCAVFIQVTAPKGSGRVLYRLVQLMTGVPTVIYGFVGIFLLVPLVRESFGRGSGLCILTAGLVLSIVIAPTMILFFTEGLASVPRSYCQAVAALGATPIQRLVYVMLPQALRSILAGIVLGLGRAVGDTMIALMLAGNAVALPDSILASARTLTAHIALVIAADFDSPEFRTIFICGLILYLATTLSVIAVSRIAAKRVERLP